MRPGHRDYGRGRRIMAKTAKAAAAPASRMWLLGVATGLLLVTAAPTALLAAILLLPAGVVWLADRSTSHGVARIVLVAGLAAAMAPMTRLWSGGAGWTLAAEILSDVRTPALAWTAEGAAWLAAVLAPLFVRLMLDLGAAAQSARLRAARRTLEEDWGLPPAQADPDP